MSNTYIWLKPEYSESGIKEIVTIIYNPYDEPAKNILKEFVIPESQHKCTARNHYYKKQIKE